MSNVDNIMTHECTCEVCGTKFTPLTAKLGIYCSQKCRQVGSNEKTRLKNQEEFLKQHGDDPDMPICKVCGWKAFDLTTHITKFHKIPMKDYYSQYNCDATSILHRERREDRRDRKLGSKNVFYDHKGKFSAVSKNCAQYEGLSNEEKEQKIQEVIDKQRQGREEGGGYTTRVNYWLKKGFSLDESILKVQERQRTFSLEICIRKYGREEGRRIWEQRQQVWLDSLYANMTEEEYIQLKQRKIQSFVRGWSQIAFELFTQLHHQEAIYAYPGCDDEATITIQDGSEFCISVDYMLGNCVIEFYGDDIHANPLYFTADEESKGIITKKAHQIWERDAAKQKLITDAGFKLLVVWEHDYKWKREETIKQCRKFLGLD